MTWWFRLRRLWAQDRIRLSRRDVRLPRVEAGDRLEILGHLWAVEATTRPAGPSPGPRFILRSLSAPSRQATLRQASVCQAPLRQMSGDATSRHDWLLEGATGVLGIHWRDVVHYAVGCGARRRQERMPSSV